MAEIRLKENESLESALRRFKKQCARAGVIAEVRKREAYEKPSVKRKKNPKQLANANTGNQTGGQSILFRFLFYLHISLKKVTL